MLRRCRSLSQTGARLFGRQTSTQSNAGWIVLTTKSYGTSRKVDPGKEISVQGTRQDASLLSRPIVRDTSGLSIQAHKSLSRLPSARVIQRVFRGLRGPRCGQQTLLYQSRIDRGSPLNAAALPEKEKRKEEKKTIRATLRESVNRNLLPLHGRFADTYNCAGSNYACYFDEQQKQTRMHPLVVYNNSSNARGRCEYILDQSMFNQDG